ncbi:septal ring lytic transglycosylase RlpA family protein [Rhodanobacter sp. B2A1Ga4]|uniref:septal ring lytic transglycosylase RlpA family protein n=1 Tax=Rhodanobacter TaxID=75309 RepID=UPI000D3AC896|nr:MULTISPECIES: septal ring lytic transglycosylase RlpA family protein [Rhodanobacter]MBQ4854834.1 septal ring lytic transglycosylase RlpA family protein [Rhodanobacter sp. B2A1Ga4]
MRAAGVALLVLAALLLAACGSHRTRPTHGGSHQDRAWSQPPTGSRDGFRDDLSKPQGSRYRDGEDSVPPPLDVSKLVEPVPKAEPRSLYGNKSPYTVRGQTYRVLPSARGYDERGIASFYGNKFHGYKTSSLETYDMYAFSAASTTLPLPSYARVTNLETGRSVIVRVNDRGPFHDNRLIDLSYAAAVKIGIWPKGTGLVEVRGIDPGQPLQELPPPAVVTGGHPGIYLQVGAFADADNADRLAQRLRRANLGAVQVSEAMINGQRVRRVRVGPLASVDRADQVTARIEGMGLPRPQVAVD